MNQPVSRATSMWVVMRAVWNLERRLPGASDESGATVFEIQDEAYEISGKPLARTTVATHLKILAGKGMVTHSKRGRFLLYRPVIDEPEAVAEEIEIFLDNVIHDDPGLLESLQERTARRLKKARRPAVGRRGRRS